MRSKASALPSRNCEAARSSVSETFCQPRAGDPKALAKKSRRNRESWMKSDEIN
jgi:hypothetical protein